MKYIFATLFILCGVLVVACGRQLNIEYPENDPCNALQLMQKAQAHCCVRFCRANQYKEQEYRSCAYKVVEAESDCGFDSLQVVYFGMNSCNCY